MKRKTLPDDFLELAARGDVDALKDVYETRRLDAYLGRATRTTALALRGCPDELARWLVARGLDVDVPDANGCTPLWLRAQAGEPIDVLIELGADVNAAGRGVSPLHAAIFRPAIVRTLVDHGADVHAVEYRRRNALACGLHDCQNAHLTSFVDSARILLAAGAAPPADAEQLVTRIGERFEFHRDSFRSDSVAAFADALSVLYGLFAVEPVAARRSHDGTSPITVSATTWTAQFDELWSFLVPGSGSAATQQGELIRLAGRLAHEILDNGAINWRAEHRNMVDALVSGLAAGSPVATGNEVAALGAVVRTGRSDAEAMTAMDRLSELAVAWVLAHPHPVPNLD